MPNATEAIFQATFLADGFYTKCDVLKPGEAPGTWDILEIKGTNSKKEGSEDRDHISDLAFQKHVLELAGIRVGRTHLVHLNKEYVRTGPLDLQALFIIDDSSEQVNAVAGELLGEMQAALEYLHQPEAP